MSDQPEENGIPGPDAPDPDARPTQTTRSGASGWIRPLLRNLEALAANGIDVVPAAPATEAPGKPDSVGPESRTAPDASPVPDAPPGRPSPESPDNAPSDVPPTPPGRLSPESPDNAPSDVPPAPPPAGSPQVTLESLAREVAACTRCPLHRTRQHPVFGEGPSRPGLLFVGEGPGGDEDRTGRPFVGAAGQLLDRIIQAMTLRREDVYIANIVKCRPPDNRVPDPEETAACLPFLQAQIRLLDPKVICTLGAPASRTLLQTDQGINRLRGKRYPYPEDPRIVLIPTFHPAYLLRRPEEKRKTWMDIQMVMQELGLRPRN